MSPTKATKKPALAGTQAADKKPVGGARASGTGPAAKAPAVQAKPGAANALPKGAMPASKNGGPAAAKSGSSSGPLAKPAVSAPAAKPALSPPATASAPAPADGKVDAREQNQEVKRDRPPSAIQSLASELIAAGDVHAVLRHAAALEDERENAANQAARLIQELAETKPELIVPLIERFARLVASRNKRVVATCAAALAPLSRIAPAQVAKQLPVLTHNWEHTTEEGKDGLVRTFAGLCTASVAYQKRLEPALARALGEAEPKLLIRWTEIVLPALKGEPHARARAVVEERLPVIPRPQAQKIADFLGIKLRPLPR
jgi:hypothetical protein